MLLKTLALSGLKANKGTFIGLSLLMVLMAATLTFALCLYTDLDERQGQAISEAQAGDVLLSTNKAELSDELIDDVAALDKVKEVKVTESLTASTNYWDASGDQLGTADALNICYEPWGEAIGFNVFEGEGTCLTLVPHEDAMAPASDEIYVPIGTQATLGLALGDTVAATIGDIEHRFTITRFIEDPQIGSPFVEMSQYLVADEAFEEMSAEAEELSAPASGLLLQAEAGMAYQTRTLNIFMTDDARDGGMTTSEFAAYIDGTAITGTLSTGFLSAEVLTGYSMLVVSITCALLLVFALLMYVIALVISVHTVSSSIQENFSNFAILKAVGVTNATLRRSFVVQYLVCAIVGCLVGAAAGLALVPVAFPAFAVLTGVLAKPGAVPIILLAALVGLIVAIVLIVYGKTRRVARISPLSALRSGVEDVHFSSLLTVPAAGRPLDLRLAWRALTSSKKSYLGAFACALLLAAFVMLTFGIGSSLRTMEDSYKAFGIWQSDVSVKLSDGVEIADVESVLNESTPVKSLWQEGMSMQNIDGESRTMVGLSDFSMMTGITEGSAPRYDNEVVLGYKLADSMGLSIGDEIMLPDADAESGERPYIVSGLLSAMLNAGYGILMTYDGLENVRGGDSSADQSYQIALEDASQADQARELLAERYGDAVDTTATGIFTSTADLMVLIHDLFIFAGYAMDVIAVLLAVVAVTLIIGRMFSMERRDLGIYRALGFTTLGLRSQFALRFLIVSLLGCIVAGVLVSLGGSWLTSQLFGTFGVTSFDLDTSPMLIGSLACGLALVFFLAAFWSARKVSRISTSILITD